MEMEAALMVVEAELLESKAYIRCTEISQMYSEL